MSIISYNGYIEVDDAEWYWAPTARQPGGTDQDLPYILKVVYGLHYSVPSQYSVTEKGFRVGYPPDHPDWFSKASRKVDPPNQSGEYYLHISTRSAFWKKQYYIYAFIKYYDADGRQYVDKTDYVPIVPYRPPYPYARLHDDFIRGLSTGLVSKGQQSLMDSSEGGGGGSLAALTVQSGISTVTHTPPSGFYGFGSVIVTGDGNLRSENIKEGISILGVQGSYAPDDYTSQIKTIKIESNGTTTVMPDDGFDGLYSVEIQTDVPNAVRLQSKTVTPSAVSQTITPSQNYDGLSQVIVNGSSTLIPDNIRKGISIFGVRGDYDATPITLQSKSVIPNRDIQVIEADSEFTALSSVMVYGDSNLEPVNIRSGITIFGVTGTYENDMVLQHKDVRPGADTFEVYADDGYGALSSVTVIGDSNLTVQNIAKGVTIFGKTGTYVSPMRALTVTPRLESQYIIPPTGFDGFSSVTVAAAGSISEWQGTQAEYDALSTYDNNTVYYIEKEVT